MLVADIGFIIKEVIALDETSLPCRDVVVLLTGFSFLYELNYVSVLLQII